MRYTYPLIAFFLCLSSSAQWEWQTGSTGIMLQNKMQFMNASTGFMVGTNAFPNGNAMIKRTTNGGSSWTTVFSKTPDFTPSMILMTDIHMVDQNIGFACGGGIDEPTEGLLVRTTNGGTSWEEVAHGLAQSKFLALHFFDGSNGFMASNGLWRTNNGGTSWTSVSLPDGVTDLIDLHFVNSQVGFGLANTTSALIRTTDGGNTWSTVDLPTSERLSEIDLYDADRGLLACRNGVILYTTDGGVTWNSGTNPDPDQAVVSTVKMTSPTVGHAGTLDGKLLKTTDGGQTWSIAIDVSTLSPALLLASIYHIDFPTPQTGYACGSLLGTFVKTTNAGGVVGIVELRKEHLRMAPNPAITHISYDNEDVRSLHLYSTDGRMIEQYAGAQLNGTLGVAGLTPGAYILRTIGKDVIREGLFIKE
jgi:photosystem II stability/assembly factor-like uncharacterized protein